MKKYFLLALLISLSVATINANEPFTCDTTLIYKNNIIKLQDSIGQLTVKAYNNDSTPMKKVFEGIYTDEKTYEKWTVSEELGFDLPILDKITGKHKKTSGHRMHNNWQGFGWGFANVTDGKFQFNGMNNFMLNASKSNEFYFNPFGKIFPLIKNSLGITTGLGLGWHNYIFADNYGLTQNNDGTISVTSAPVGRHYTFSRLRTFQFTVPILFELEPGYKNKFYISAGVIGCANVFSSYKLKYQDEIGNSHTEYLKKPSMILPVSIDLMAQIGYGSWGIYTKYSPYGIFSRDKGPNAQGISIGGKLNF